MFWVTKVSALVLIVERSHHLTKWDPFPGTAVTGSPLPPKETCCVVFPEMVPLEPGIYVIVKVAMAKLAVRVRLRVTEKVNDALVDTTVPFSVQLAKV